jgi:hypothetical protein
VVAADSAAAAVAADSTVVEADTVVVAADMVVVDTDKVKSGTRVRPRQNCCGLALVRD